MTLHHFLNYGVNLTGLALSVGGAILGARASRTGLLRVAFAVLGASLGASFGAAPLLLTGDHPVSPVNWQQVFFTPLYLQHRAVIHAVTYAVFIVNVTLWALVLFRAVLGRRQTGRGRPAAA